MFWLVVAVLSALSEVEDFIFVAYIFEAHFEELFYSFRRIGCFDRELVALLLEDGLGKLNVQQRIIDALVS